MELFSSSFGVIAFVEDRSILHRNKSAIRMEGEREHEVEEKERFLYWRK